MRGLIKQDVGLRQYRMSCLVFNKDEDSYTHINDPVHHLAGFNSIQYNRAFLRSLQIKSVKLNLVISDSDSIETLYDLGEFMPKSC